MVLTMANVMVCVNEKYGSNILNFGQTGSMYDNGDKDNADSDDGHNKNDDDDDDGIMKR